MGPGQQLTGLEEEALIVVRWHTDRDLGTCAHHVVDATNHPTTLEKCRAALRHLDEVGLTELVPLYDDEGFLRGRGRLLTPAGRTHASFIAWRVDVAWCGA